MSTEQFPDQSVQVIQAYYNILSSYCLFPSFVLQNFEICDAIPETLPMRTVRLYILKD